MNKAIRVVVACFALPANVGFISAAGATSDVAFDLNGRTLVLAEEIFGNRAASVPLGAARPPTTTLTIIQGDAEGGRLTYRLSGEAEFSGRDITAADFSFSASASSQADPVFSVLEGGRVGDKEVTVQLMTSAEQPMVTGDSFTLTVPALQRLGTLIEEDGGRIIVESIIVEPLPGVDNSFPSVTLGRTCSVCLPHTNTNDLLVEVLNKITLRYTSASFVGGVINVDDPARISTLFDYNITTSDGIRQGIVLGFTRVSTHFRIRRVPDGAEDFALAPNDRLTIVVSGDNFDAYKFAFYDSDRDQTVDPGEIIPIQDNEARLSFNVDSPNGRVMTEENLSRPLYLVLDGVTTISPSRFLVRVELDYADPTYRDESITGPDIFVVLGDNSPQLELAATTVQLAEELFGPALPPEAAFGGGRVSLEITRGLVDPGQEATLTWRLLDGARFGGRALTEDDLQLASPPENRISSFMVNSLSGGEPGDTSVTFQVETGATGGLLTNDQLRLTLPGLQLPSRTGAGKAFRVQLAISATRDGIAANFPSLDPLTDGRDGHTILNDVLMEVANRFTLVTSQEGAQLGDGTSLLGSLGITRAGGAIKRMDGLRDLFIRSQDRLIITLNGTPTRHDLAFIDLNEDGVADERELFSPANELVLGGAGTEAGFLINDEKPVYLLPGSQVSFANNFRSATLTLDFADPGHLDESITTRRRVVTRRLVGLRPLGFAYAVPNCTQRERASIHITNESADAQTIYMQGRDEAGLNLGIVELDASLLRGGGDSRWRAYESLDLLTEQIEQHFMENDGGFAHGSLCEETDTWRGRAQLTFHGRGNITILPQLQGSRGELRDLGGYIGLRVGDRRIVK